VKRLWRWLTCGHGRHAWRVGAAYDLDEPVPAMSGLVNWLEHGGRVVAARHCPRCDLVEIVE
jgi:hypothetical protein